LHASEVVGVSRLEFDGRNGFAADLGDVTGRRYGIQISKVRDERNHHTGGKYDDYGYKHPFQPGVLPAHEIQH
jgi:hypothetical protein